MAYLWIITALALSASAVASRRKTRAALKIAVRRFAGVLPMLAVMLILLALVTALLPDEVVVDLLGTNSGWRGIVTAAVLGSVTLMPGFLAFPLCGALLTEGASYMVLSAFTTTLMTVGILTYPLERQYLGRNVTLVRNGVALAIALIVAVATGFVFGELTL
jgi:uncharacterized membrane protein YraQ (UPF0718 family)